MKKIIIFVLLISSFSFSDMVDKSKFDDIFNQLSQRRVGLTEELINSMIDPFPAPSIKSTILRDKYDLTGIFGDRVKINGKWYRLNENVGIYKIKSINAKSVVLVNDTQKLELKLKEGRKNVSITYN